MPDPLFEPRAGKCFGDKAGRKIEVERGSGRDGENRERNEEKGMEKGRNK